MMKMKKAAVLILAVLMTSCADVTVSESSGEKPVTTEQSSTASGASVPNEVFDAVINGYSEGILTFTSDKEYSLPMDVRCFENDSYTAGLNLLSELIIDNPFSEKVLGRVQLSFDGTKVISCDVISPNGEFFNNTMFYTGTEPLPPEKTEARMRRLGGSACELYNDYGKLTADLNDLDSYCKYDFPEALDRVMFDGYRFKSGKFILRRISVFSEVTDEGGLSYRVPDCRDKYSFFGKIRSVKDGRAEVLLTDGKTLCSVPTYYTDGKLKEGTEIMLTLNAGPSLYGSGEKYKADHAVFITDLEAHGIRPENFDSYAYARSSETDVTKYDIVSVSELKEGE